LLAALGLASCGKDESEADLPPAELVNRIEALSQIKDPVEPVQRRLGVLADADIPGDFRTGRSCRLHQQDRLLLIAAAPGAVARIDGRPIRLRVSGPVGPTGGFFVAEGVTVSVGREDPPEATGPSTRAGVTVGGHPKTPLEKLEGSWVCTA
jgi:hypothetical protein